MLKGVDFWSVSIVLLSVGKWLLPLTGLMNWMVRQSTELEVNMNAVERVIEYTKLTPEKPPIIANHRPPQGWPSQGVVEAQDLVVRYREDLDPVLRNISFKTWPHEKIGVVGRTGRRQFFLSRHEDWSSSCLQASSYFVHADRGGRTSCCLHVRRGQWCLQAIFGPACRGTLCMCT